MLNFFSIFIGKAIIFLSYKFNLGSGSTWPGHIALKLNKNFIEDILRHSETKIIIVAGTNGKTTTSRLITSIVRENEKTYLQNKAGANLINGLASTLVRGSTLTFSRSGLSKLKQDYLIFKSYENALPQIISITNPDYIICLNLFRDQLDRYGEVDSIAKKWQQAFEKLNEKTKLILNADDPQIAYLENQSKTKAIFFGLEKSKSNEIKHGADSTHCPKCQNKLTFKSVTFSHLGIWECTHCKLKRPNLDISEIKNYPLSGEYNKYNILAAFLLGQQEKIGEKKIYKAFESFTPAFGRQEELKYGDKKIKLFLSKNPTSFNESLNTIKELGGKNIFIILNDKIPDGQDVSWIWDINFESILTKDMNIGISGDRVFDMSLRLKYAEFFAHHHEDPKIMLDIMIESIDRDETLFILPNYSAMLEIRKIITGRKIL